MNFSRCLVARRIFKLLTNNLIFASMKYNNLPVGGGGHWIILTITPLKSLRYSETVKVVYLRGSRSDCSF